MRSSFLPIGIALVILVSVVLVASRSGASANHGAGDNDPNFNWVHTYTMWDVYPSNNWPGWGGGPSRDHDLSVRVCVGYWNEGTYAAWDWTRRIGFNSQSNITYTPQPNCGDGSTNILFWLTTEANVRDPLVGCNVPANKPTPVACFKPAAWDFDSFLGRDEIKRVTIPIWKAWLDSHPSYAIHVFEHELGHGMGLEHHDPCTNFLMESRPCNGWWVSTPDVTTTRCNYLYAC